MQVYHGTQYIDEVAGLRLPHGRAYVHQGSRSELSRAADQGGRISEPSVSARRGTNWNATSLTDLKLAAVLGERGARAVAFRWYRHLHAPVVRPALIGTRTLRNSSGKMMPRRG